jgi:AGZA family xanthine/uracil permease-like MFS transporter
MGILPGVGAWGALMAKNGLRAAGYGAPDGPAFSSALVARFERTDTWIGGAFALEQGFIFTAMILSAATVCVIEHRFERAAIWCWAAALLSLVGLMHTYTFTPSDTVVHLAPAIPWATGYAIVGALLFAARWITVPERQREGAPSARPRPDSDAASE